MTGEKNICNSSKLKSHRWAILPPWDCLPPFLQVEEVKPYYETLKKHRTGLLLKRCFDILVGSLMTVILAIPMGIIAIIIKIDSKGPVFFRQERVTTYGNTFRIHKFRTMVDSAETIGPTVTILGDKRITNVGSMLRKYRLDELPQVFDILSGNMSFVGTRPEAVKYVKEYSSEMFATLLMPAGVTSEASIRFKDEGTLLTHVPDADAFYVEKIIPAKMFWNLESIRQFRFLGEILIIGKTALVVLGKKSKIQTEEL